MVRDGNPTSQISDRELPPDERGLQLPQPPLPPPPEPEPSKDDLGAEIDWMTYSHRELYQMAKQGVDVSGASEVSVGWAKIGQKLEDIAGDLQRAMEGSVHGWQGAAAERARESVHKLITWSNETGQTAGKVANCIAIEAEHAQQMRSAMPPPPAREHEPPTLPEPQPVAPASSTSTSPMSASDFGSAQAVPDDPLQQQQSRHVVHQQAADVMRTFQRGSNDVYSAVPEFSSPTGSSITEHPKPDPPPRPKPEDDPKHDTGTDPSSTPGPGGGAGGAGGGVAAGAGGGGYSGALGAGALAAGGRTGQEAPLPGGSRAGVGEGAAAARGASGAGGGASGGGRGMMGMPMGAGMGQRGADDDRKVPGYLEEDSDIWKPDGKVAPPVIGEDPNRA